MNSAASRAGTKSVPKRTGRHTDTSPANGTPFSDSTGVWFCQPGRLTHTARPRPAALSEIIVSPVESAYRAGKALVNRMSPNGKRVRRARRCSVWHGLLVSRAGSAHEASLGGIRDPVRCRRGVGRPVSPLAAARRALLRTANKYAVPPDRTPCRRMPTPCAWTRQRTRPRFPRASHRRWRRFCRLTGGGRPSAPVQSADRDLTRR